MLLRYIGTLREGINPLAWDSEKVQMKSDHYCDVVGLRIGEWVVCMRCVSTFLLRDAKENDFVSKNDIQGNHCRCIRCEREIE
jgi:hypothetical protein